MIGAVIYAKELDKLVAFYASFGFEVVEAEPGDYAVLAAAGTELSIVQIPERIAAGIEIAEPPEVRGSSPVKLSFEVTSIDEALAAALLGGRIIEVAGRWEFRGKVVQDAIDPEGNIYQLCAVL